MEWELKKKKEKEKKKEMGEVDRGGSEHVPRDVIEEAYNEVRLGQPRVFPAGNLRKEVGGEHFEEEKPVGNLVDVNETTFPSIAACLRFETLPLGPGEE